MSGQLYGCPVGESIGPDFRLGSNSAVNRSAALVCYPPKSGHLIALLVASRLGQTQTWRPPYRPMMPASLQRARNYGARFDFADCFAGSLGRVNGA
jgi:hypothetical protein